MAPTQALLAGGHRSSRVVQHGASRCRRHVVVPCSASTGFGSTAKPKKDAASKDATGSYLLPKKSKKVDIRKELSEGNSASKDATVPSTSSAFVNEAGSNWLQMTTLSAFPEGKDRKVIELANKGMLLVYRHKGALYCSDLYSTAYRFPLLDGPITDGPTGPQITVPLDGTVYDLATGKVLSWCPSSAGNPLQGLFAGLKRSATPVDLPVYPVRQQGDAVFVNYTPGKQAQ